MVDRGVGQHCLWRRPFGAAMMWVSKHRDIVSSWGPDRPPLAGPCHPVGARHASPALHVGVTRVGPARPLQGCSLALGKTAIEFGATAIAPLLGHPRRPAVGRELESLKKPASFMSASVRRRSYGYFVIARSTSE